MNGRLPWTGTEVPVQWDGVDGGADLARPSERDGDLPRERGVATDDLKVGPDATALRDPSHTTQHEGGAGRPVDAGMVVELEPLFRDVFLGGEITRLDRVVEAATAGGRLLRPVGGEGRRFALTEAGAERARSARRGFIGRLPMWQRLLLIAVILALVLAVLAQ